MLRKSAMRRVFLEKSEFTKDEGQYAYVEDQCCSKPIKFQLLRNGAIH